MAKVLVVDDSSLIRMKCSQLLAGNGYQVLEAENGVEALRMYRESRPDCVLLDSSAEMHVFETLQELRKIDPRREACSPSWGRRPW
jgi:CheY-like chemotaxis protein